MEINSESEYLKAVSLAEKMADEVDIDEPKFNEVLSAIGKYDVIHYPVDSGLLCETVNLKIAYNELKS